MQNDDNTLDVQEEHQENEAEETTEVVETSEDRLKKLENENAKLQRLLAKARKPQSSLQTPERSPQSGVETDTLIDNFAVINQYSDVLQEIRKESKDLNVDLFKYINSGSGQKFIESLRHEKKAESTTLAPSHRGVAFKGKPVTEVLKDESVSDSEKQAAFEAMMRGVKR